jgi:hypothetical protein
VGCKSGWEHIDGIAVDFLVKRYDGEVRNGQEKLLDIVKKSRVGTRS